MSQRILVVEDEKPLREFVARNLSVRGYEVLKAANGMEALAIFQNQPLDLIILDLMMPHMDGLELTQRIRRTSTVPIIVLSALDEERDKVTALDLGADDYLTKPFGVEELLARVRGLLRRASWQHAAAPQERLRVGDIEMIVDQGLVMVKDRPVKLTRTEFDLLHYFMKNVGKVLPHRLILQQVWGPEYGNEVEYLRVYVGRLRRKVEADPAHPRHILTEHGVGYRIVG